MRLLASTVSNLQTPNYKGDEPEIGKELPEVAVSRDEALQRAGDLSFGYTKDSAW